MDISVRNITSADNQVVVSLYKNGWLETYPNEKFGIHVEDVRAATKNFMSTTIHKNKFVAEVFGKVCGVISVKEGSVYIVQSLYVSKKYQDKGVGTTLVNFTLEKFGNVAYELQVAEYNTKAINFYKKFGFEVVADSLESVKINNLKIPQITMRKSINI